MRKINKWIDSYANRFICCCCCFGGVGGHGVIVLCKIFWKKNGSRTKIFFLLFCFFFVSILTVSNSLYFVIFTQFFTQYCCFVVFCNFVSIVVVVVDSSLSKARKYCHNLSMCVCVCVCWLATNVIIKPHTHGKKTIETFLVLDKPNEESEIYYFYFFFAVQIMFPNHQNEKIVMHHRLCRMTDHWKLVEIKFYLPENLYSLSLCKKFLFISATYICHTHKNT